MKSTLKISIGLAALAAPLLVTPAFADIVVGSPGNGANCFPFGCTFWGPEYQQIYAASNFPGTTTIAGLEFYIDIGSAASTGNYTISLSTTSAVVDALDLTTLSNNIGPDNTVVFDGSLPALEGATLHIVLSTPFTYDPSDGNLLMDVYAPNPGAAGSGFEALNGGANGRFSRAMTPGCCSPSADWGLVTGFSTGVVPEPPTWALMALGFGGLAFATRNWGRKAALDRAARA